MEEIMNIKSGKKIVNKSASEIYNFLTDTNNFGTLLPKEVKDWKSEGNSCSFKIEGIAEITFTQEGCIQDRLVKYVASGKVPFPIELQFTLEPIDETHTEAELEIAGKANPFVSMMIERPAKNLIGAIMEKL